MPKQNSFKIMYKLLFLIKKLWILMFMAIIFGSIGHLLAISIPFLGVVLITNPELKNFIIKFLIFAGIFRGIFRYLEQALNHELAFRVLASLRDIVFGKLRDLAPAKLDSKDRGTLISLLTGDIEHLEVFFAHTISPIGIAIIVNGIVLFIMYQINPIFMLISLVAYTLIGVVVPIYFSKKSRKIGLKYRDALGKTHSFILESVMGLQDIKQFSMQANKTKELKDLSDELNTSQSLMGRFTENNLNVVDIILIASNFLFIVYAFSTKMEMQTLLVGLTLNTSSFGPVIALANLANNMFHTLASGERVLNLLEEKPMIIETENDELIKFEEAVFDSVSFKYKDQFILDEFNLEINKSEILGIKGKSGSGKSTLIKLLMRYYDPDKGNIKISGQDLKEIDANNLKNIQALMSQSTDLFQMSIKDNLKIARPQASDDEIIEAAKMAGIHEFISKLDQGYETNIKEFGSSLSSGEIQRLALARLFLKDSDLLLLDEPTSNLDSLNEALILNNLSKYSKDKTILITSHRLSTLNITDRLINFD